MGRRSVGVYSNICVVVR